MDLRPVIIDPVSTAAATSSASASAGFTGDSLTAVSAASMPIAARSVPAAIFADGFED